MKKVLLLFVVLLGAFGLAACVEQEVEATLSRIEIKSEITKDEYNLGENLNLAGLVITAVMSNGVEEDLATSEFTVSGFDNTLIGVQVITVSYEGLEVMFSVTVFDPDADKEILLIEILSLPDQQVYLKDDTFDDEGLVVRAVYNTGEKEIITDYDLSGFNSAGLTETGLITVVYESKLTTIPYKVRDILVQGVTADTITVGNTAATSGFFSVVGIPFNAGIRAYFHKVNEAGGINDRDLEFITYDDTFNAETGTTYTKKLVEEDNVFALVGHFGTPTVGATLGYIQEIGVPMVYAATGINALFFEQEDGLNNPVMSVQPIYLTDGRIMTARALNEAIFGANKDQKLASDAKVGVLYTNDDAGASMKAGIEIQALTEDRDDDFVYRSIAMVGAAVDPASLNSAVLDLIAAGVDAILIAANQGPFKSTIGNLEDNGNTAPVFTSYVSASATAVDETITYSFDMYANAWIDIVDPDGDYGFSAAYWTFAADMTAAGYPEFSADPFAIAGYVAASIFVQGLERVGTDELTWESFIKAMESDPLQIPMGGMVDFTNGQRNGIAQMALLKLDQSGDAPAWVKIREIEDISVIQAK